MLDENISRLIKPNTTLQWTNSRSRTSIQWWPGPSLLPVCAPPNRLDKATLHVGRGTGVMTGVLSSSHLGLLLFSIGSSTSTPFPPSGMHCVIRRGSRHKKAVTGQTATCTAQGTRKTPIKWCGSNWLKAQANSGPVSCRSTSQVEQHQQEQGQVQGRMNSGSNRSTGFEEHNHEQHWSRHWSKTDWANLTRPLIGTALRVVLDRHVPCCCFSQWEASRWDRSRIGRLPGEILNSFGFSRLPLSGYWRGLDWAVYIEFNLETGIFNYDVLTKLLCKNKSTLSDVIIT